MGKIYFICSRLCFSFPAAQLAPGSTLLLSACSPQSGPCHSPGTGRGRRRRAGRIWRRQALLSTLDRDGPAAPARPCLPLLCLVFLSFPCLAFSSSWSRLMGSLGWAASWCGTTLLCVAPAHFFSCLRANSAVALCAAALKLWLRSGLFLQINPLFYQI